MTTLRTADLEAAVDAILARAGEDVVCGTPLGLGKPVPLLNALYVISENRFVGVSFTSLHADSTITTQQLTEKILKVRWSSPEHRAFTTNQPSPAGARPEPESSSKIRFGESLRNIASHKRERSWTTSSAD